MRGRWWAPPAVFLALALAWTWPAAVAGPSALAVRHFDGVGMAWIADAGARLFPGMIDPLTGWPGGAEYHRPEQWLVVLLSPLLRLVDGAVLFNWLGIFGVAASATAAEAFARRLGARAPWSYVGGVAFGFNGIAATALLEGHVYHVMDPWLPLLGIAWLDATGPEGRPRDGLLAGVWFVLTALTTAYLGIAAAVVVIGFALPALGRRGLRPLGAMLPALLVVVPFAAWYLHGYARGTLNEGLAAASPAEVAARIQAGSASLVALAGPTPELDRAGHSVAATLSATVLALCLVAPVILRRARPGEAPARWRGVLATGAVALVLSLGPRLALDPLHPTVPLPLSLLEGLPGAGYLRFPLRLGWVWALCGGAVAACVAQVLAERVRAAHGVLALVVVEAFLVVRLPFRQATQVGTVPSAYAAASGPVLDLYPVSEEDGDDLNSWSKAWACYYQTVHQRPIADHCLETTWARNPRARLVEPLTALLFARDAAAARALLAEAGFATVAFHPDFYTAADRAALTDALAALDPAPVRSTDGGELVIAYAIEAAP